MTSIWYADGPDSAALSPTDALTAAGLATTGSPSVTLGWTVERFPWIDDPEFTCRTMMGGYALSKAVNEGRIVAAPIRLSAVPRLIEEERPDVAVIGGIRRGKGVAFGCSVGWADTLARTARSVVVEVDPTAPDLGAPDIPGNVVAVVERTSTTAATRATSRAGDDVDLAIGAMVVSLMPDRPTLQFGPGGIGEGIARAIDRPVRIHSGLVTDAMAGLDERGLLLEPVVAAYAWGGDPIVALAERGMLRLSPISFTHDLSAVSATPGFVGCNTAVQIGLDGAVNLERVGGRAIAGIGGHADFCVAASRSTGGRSIIALRSEAAGRSTIVPRVEVVSTGRSDVDVVVTEHGIADLRGAPDDERARRLVAIAAPVHRDALMASWKDLHS